MVYVRWGYYYNGRDENGDRCEISLGSDLDAARTEWVRLERAAEPPKPKHLMGAIFGRYEREIIPARAHALSRTTETSWSSCARLSRIPPSTPSLRTLLPSTGTPGRRRRAVTGKSPCSRTSSTSPGSGLTDKENPCARVRRNKERARYYYAADDVWGCVYAHAVQELRDAMDLAYLTGQRPADSIKPIVADLTDKYMLIAQGKSKKRLRIRLHSDDGELTGLGRFIEGLLERRKLAGIRSSTLITNPNGLRLSYAMLRNRWNEARARAAKAAEDDGDRSLAERIRSFQFRDIRPEIEDLTAASRLWGHSKEQITKTVYRRVGEVVNRTK